MPVRLVVAGSRASVSWALVHTRCNTMNQMLLSVMAIMLSGLTTCAGAQVGALKTGDPRVEKLLEESDLKYRVDKDGDFRIGNKMEGDRTQIAFILSNTSELGSLEIRQIWSVGYHSKSPFSESVANRLLEQNSKVKLGAWQVRKMGEDYVAVFVAQIAADTDKLSLLVTLHAVTTTADEMEKELTGKDDF